jgi:hypothetical protein
VFAGKTIAFIPVTMGIDLTEGWASVLKKQADELGMKFEVRDPHFSADAGAQAITSLISENCIGGMGLYRVDKLRNPEKLTAETNRTRLSVIDDSRMRLADDLDIASDGKVYFNEATIRYGFEEWVVDALEGRGNGRIIRYDPASGATRTIVRNLLFANGVCIAHDNKSMLFAETWARGRRPTIWR